MLRRIGATCAKTELDRLAFGRQRRRDSRKAIPVLLADVSRRKIDLGVGHGSSHKHMIFVLVFEKPVVHGPRYSIIFEQSFAGQRREASLCSNSSTRCNQRT